MKFTLEFDCDNAAFGATVDARNDEIARILAVAAADIMNHQGLEQQTLRDLHDNVVGKWQLR